MNITDYNAFIWSRKILGWFKEEAFRPGKVVDICAGSGVFVSRLVAGIEGARGVAVDLAPPRPGLVDSFPADLTHPGALDGLGKTDLVCLMNSLYVLGDLDELERYIRVSEAQDLVLSVPTRDALDIYEARHPGKNHYGTQVEEFIDRIGFSVHRKAGTCRAYYLKSPLSVFVGSITPSLASVVDKLHGGSYYELLWAKRRQ